MSISPITRQDITTFGPISYRFFPFNIAVRLSLYKYPHYKYIRTEAKTYNCEDSFPQFEFEVDVEDKTALIQLSCGGAETEWVDDSIVDGPFKYCDVRAVSAWGSKETSASTILWFDPDAKFVVGTIRTYLTTSDPEPDFYFELQFKFAPTTQYCPPI